MPAPKKRATTFDGCRLVWLDVLNAKQEFSIDEVVKASVGRGTGIKGSTIFSNHVAHIMVCLGFIEKVGRKKYKVLSPEDCAK